MKRFSLLCVLAILCSLPLTASFGSVLGGMNRIVKIVFGWSKRCICPLAKQRNTIRSSISTDENREGGPP